MFFNQYSMDLSVAITPPSSPIRVGIVGTGFAAQRRAEAFQADRRAVLVGVTGHRPESTQAFSQRFNIPAIADWSTLVTLPEVDLVVISTINRDHAAIAQSALEAGKHTVIEYPLALEVEAGRRLLALAQQQKKLLHIEHIELLGGLHQAIRRYLPEIGEVFYARYATLQVQNPAPRRWTYHHQDFGFPLTAALSRLHRFTDLFGPVLAVTCHSRFWDIPETDYFRACLCNAQLQFPQGLMVETLYGKGEVFHQPDRTFILQGDRGTLAFDGEKGYLIRGEAKTPLEVGGRRGLFAQDTQAVLDYLYEGTPLYVQPTASLYALEVAAAAQLSAQLSAQQGQTVFLPVK